MTLSATAGVRPSWRHFALSLTVLTIGLVPLSGRAKTVRDSVRSLEPNRAEREAGAAGYYEGLMGVEAGQGTRGELSLRLLGKPTEWVRFQAANVSRPIASDFLVFELKPNVDTVLFGHRFTTNTEGMRDREYRKEKPPGTTRIVLLGSSIDMGWGIGTDDTYANLLEDWLNLHSSRHHLGRRYEVLNFAVAAYGPAQRLEAFRRKAVEFEPDLVLYSATMLDPRLLEIHLGNVLQNQVDLHYDFLRECIADAGITEADLRLDSSGVFVDKAAVKNKVGARFWNFQDAILGDLAARCRSLDVPLALLIVPRAGRSDAPEARALPVARYKGVAAHHAIPVIDLTDSFDKLDPAKVEIAAWDDHPNVEGHRRLFLGLARALVAHPEFSKSLFSTNGLNGLTEPSKTAHP